MNYHYGHNLDASSPEAMYCTDCEVDVPNPGSTKALEGGCSCPVLDNDYGIASRDSQGKYIPMFYLSSDCPLHGFKVSDPEKKK